MPHTSDGPPDIHRPPGVPPDHVHAFCRARAVVPVPPEAAFALLGDVARWPGWAPAVAAGRPDGPRPAERGLELRFHGHRFEVVVGERVAPHRLGWSGAGEGVRLSQAWRLSAVEDGTHVVTENAVHGSRPAAGVLDATSRLWARRLNSLWLAQLGRLSAEGHGPGAPADS